MKTSSLLATALAASTSLGCDDSIHQGWLVDRTRVLGARVEAAGEPERAALAPSESARITWLVAAREGTPNLNWAFAACVPPVGNFAEPTCEAPLLAAGSGSASGELVAMDLEVPPAAALAEADELLVLTAFCSDGFPELDARTFTATCASAEPLLASLLVGLARGGANANPPPPSLRLGATLLPGDAGGDAGDACESAPNAPEIAAGAPAVDLVYVFDGAEREAGESILLSTFVTAGELDRQYSAFDPEEQPPKEVRNAWTPPGNDAVGDAGLVVRFYAVLRDGRGGASFGRFAVCVRPS